MAKTIERVWLAACLAFFAPAAFAHSATLTWDGNTSSAGLQDGAGTWDTTVTNRWWNGSSYVAWTNSGGTAPHDAQIGQGTTASAGGDIAITLGANVTVNRITFNAPAITGAYAINGSSTLTLAGAGEINVAYSTTGVAPGRVIINAPISGVRLVSTNVTGGSLQLTNTSNSFAGATVQGGGQLNYTSNAALGAVGHTIIVQGNSVFTYQGGSPATIDRPISVGSGGGTFRNAVSSTLTLGGTNGIAGDGNQVSFRADSASTPVVVNGVVSGVGTNLVKTSHGGMVTLQKANTYTGATQVLGGTLRIANGDDRLPTSTNLQVSSGAIFDLNGQNQTINGLSGAGTVDGRVSGTAVTRTLTIGYGDATGLDFTGTITDTVGTLNLEKTGSGTQILSGANSYAGTTTISGGVLQIGAGGTTGELGAGAVTNNATLVFNRSNTLIVANNISGSGTLIKNGNDQLALTGNNSGMTGAVFVNNERLVLTNVNAGSAAAAWHIANTGVINVNSNFVNNATLHLGALSSGLADSGAVLRNGGSTAGTNTFSIGALGTDTTFAGSINDASATVLTALTKVGGGTLNLTGASNFSGPAAVNAGTLLFNGAKTGAGTITVANNATLGGEGTISGNTTIQSGGTLSPGNSPGTITFTDNLTIAPGAIYAFEDGDLTNVLGALALGNSSLSNWTLQLGAGFVDGGSIVLFNYGTLAANFDLTPTFDLSNMDFSPSGPLSLVNDTTNQRILLLGIQTAVPEPSTLLLAALGAIGAVGLNSRARRRRSA